MNRLSDAERVLGHDVSASMPGRWYAEEVVEAIVAARLASVKALADDLPALTEGPLRAGTSLWPECDRDAYSLAIEEAQAVLRAVLGSDAHTEQKETGRGFLDCKAEGPREATSPCVRLPGHDGEHLDNTGGSWPVDAHTEQP